MRRSKNLSRKGCDCHTAHYKLHNWPCAVGGSMMLESKMALVRIVRSLTTALSLHSGGPQSAEMAIG